MSDLQRWSNDPMLKVHKTIAAGKRHLPEPREIFVNRVARFTSSGRRSAIVDSLMTSDANHYGRVFMERDGLLHIEPDLKPIIDGLEWAEAQ